MGLQSRALWFVSPGRVEIRPVTVDQPAPGQVLVEAVSSGISAGTEMLAYRGEIPPEVALDDSIGALDGTFRYPFQYGYSCVGRVTVSHSGLPEGALVFAFHPHQERFVVDADEVVVLEGVPAREATLFPLVETAFQIVLDAGQVMGNRVAVLGLGVVGALTSLLLRRSGAQVVAIDPIPWRRDLVKGLADRDLVTVDPDGARDLLGTEPDRVSLLIEASGNPAALGAGLELLAHEGTALVASWYGAKDVTLPLGGVFHRRRLTLASTQVSTIPSRLSGVRDVARRRRVVADLLPELPLEALATHVFPFDEAHLAYASLARQDDGLMHAALGYG